MAVGTIDQNNLPGVSLDSASPSTSPLYTEQQLQAMTPEQLRQALRDQTVYQQLVSSGNATWDPAPLGKRQEAEQLVKDIEKLGLDIEALRDELLNPEDEDENWTPDNEDIIEAVKEAKALLKDAKEKYNQLRALAAEYPASTVLEKFMKEGKIAYKDAKKIIDLANPLEEEAILAQKLENPQSAEDFATYITETSMDAEGNYVFNLVNGNLLINLTGQDDRLEAKQTSEGIFFKITSPNGSGDWVKVPSNVKAVFINARAGNDVIELKALDLAIPITIYGGPGNDVVNFNENGFTKVFLGTDQAASNGGGGGSSELEDLGDQIGEAFGW